MPDHATHLKAINHPIRREMVQLVFDAPNKELSHEELLKTLIEKEIIPDEGVFKYNMDYLVQAECLERSEADGDVLYKLLPGGQVIENF